jgi:hypothetical protein
VIGWLPISGHVISRLASKVGQPFVEVLGNDTLPGHAFGLARGEKYNRRSHNFGTEQVLLDLGGHVARDHLLPDTSNDDEYDVDGEDDFVITSSPLTFKVSTALLAISTASPLNS